MARNRRRDKRPLFLSLFAGIATLAATANPAVAAAALVATYILGRGLFRRVPQPSGRDAGFFNSTGSSGGGDWGGGDGGDGGGGGGD